jgi:hypothetical protein
VNGRAISLVIVAFILGALAAGSIGVRVIREVNAADDATSLPDQNISTTTVAPPPAATYQVEPNETLISSTALVPTGIEVADEQLSIGYDLVTLSPHADVEPITFLGNFGVVTVIEASDLDHVFPMAWTVETSRGRIDGGPANPSTRVARFDVPEGFSASEITGVVVTEARAPYPVQAPFTLSEDDPVVDVYPGVSVELLNISDQGSTSIVQIGIDVDDPTTASFFVSGDGPGWRSAVFEAEGRPRINLTWVGEDLPSDIPLFADGTVWIPLSGTFPVSLEGIG